MNCILKSQEVAVILKDLGTLEDLSQADEI